MGFKYNRQATHDHEASVKYPSCLKSLEHLILKDYNGLTQSELKSFFSSDPADYNILSIDDVEILIAKSEKRNRNCTVDSAFVINKDDEYRILLVEFRFNYENVQNLKRIDLLNKISGSQNILKDTLSYHDKIYFVFDEKLKQLAKNRLMRMNPRVPQSFEAINLQDLAVYFNP